MDAKIILNFEVVKRPNCETLKDNNAYNEDTIDLNDLVKEYIIKDEVYEVELILRKK